MTYFSVLILVFVLNFSFRAQAQESVLAGRNYDEAKEAEIAQKARKRQYPGGRDESDLKVQTQMTNPVRKMAPTLNVSADPEPGSED